MPEVNPDSTVLRQLDEQWQKMAMLILFKCLPPGGVCKITAADMLEISKRFGPEGPAIFTHGMVDGLEFSLITHERARELAEYDRTQRAAAGGGKH